MGSFVYRQFYNDGVNYAIDKNLYGLKQAMPSAALQANGAAGDMPVLAVAVGKRVT